MHWFQICWNKTTKKTTNSLSPENAVALLEYFYFFMTASWCQSKFYVCHCTTAMGKCLVLSFHSLIFFTFLLEFFITKKHYWHTHTKDQLCGENTFHHSLLFVIPISTFAPVFLPSVLSADPVKWLQWCSWVLVMKWRFHSLAARRSLGWSAGQVRLWQGSLWYTFPHCPARTVHAFSMLIFPYGLWIFSHWTPGRKVV